MGGKAIVMRDSDFSFISNDGIEIYCYKWDAHTDNVKGVVQIAHGMAEHASRYEAFAKKLNESGYTVYANDHRGHGKSALSTELQGYLGEGRAFERLVDDMARLSEIIHRENPDKQLFLFAHSMGSFASRRYIMAYPEKIDGLILSGSNGKQGFVLSIGQIIAKIQRKIIGDKRPSNILNALAFGSYNAKFMPNRTLFDWLSTCDEAVDKYMEDQYCGAVFPASFFDEFFSTLKFIENKKNFHLIPKKLPILIVSGTDDPVGEMGKGVKRLYNHYKENGVEKLEMKLYEKCRHEIVNDSCREELFKDVLAFLSYIDKYKR